MVKTSLFGVVVLGGLACERPPAATRPAAAKASDVAPVAEVPAAAMPAASQSRKAAPPAIDAALMETIRVAIEAGDALALRPHLGADDAVQVVFAGGLDDEGNGTERTETLTGAEAVTGWLQKMHSTAWGPRCREAKEPPPTCQWFNGLVVAGPVTCDATCCRQQNMINHNTLFLDTVCFETRGPSPRLVSIRFVDGM